jgi:5-methylcytosine-specific restriction endonuclease McrA
MRGVKRCSKCGEEKELDAFVRNKRSRDGRTSRCKLCTNAYFRENYQRDLERSRAQKRAYAAANREAINAKNAERLREWRKANPELARQQSTETSRKFREANPDYHREWYQAHAETERARLRISMQQWRQANPDAERERRRRYRKNNPEAVKKTERENTYARRARQPYSPELARVMAELVQQPCAYCGALDNITIDHIVPLSRNGKHEANNLAPACISCNSSKCDRLLSEWNGRFAA